MSKNSPSSHRLAYLYKRVSTLEQVDGISLEQQEEALRSWAAANAVEIGGSYADEGISGKSMKGRDGLAEAIKQAKKAKGVLVVLNLSRLSRSTIDLLTICDELEAAGCELVSLREQVDTRSAAGRLFLAVMGAVAQFQREASNETIKANMATARKQGKRISRFAPFGWDFADDGHLVENVKEQEIRAAIISLRSNGASLSAIAATLNEQGISTKNKGKKGWAAATILSVLRYNESIKEAA